MRTIRFIGVEIRLRLKILANLFSALEKSASQFTKNLIGNQSVRLEADPTNLNRDR